MQGGGFRGAGGGKGGQQNLGHWAVIPRVCGDTTQEEERGEEGASILQSRPAPWSRRPGGGENPQLGACDSCRGLEGMCECNCVSAEPRPLPQDASSGIGESPGGEGMKHPGRCQPGFVCGEL